MGQGYPPSGPHQLPVRGGEGGGRDQVLHRRRQRGAVEYRQSSIDIVLRRFAEYHDLQGAFSRRALIERAKGILMKRHRIDEAAAFTMMRDESRIANRKLIDLATAVVDRHRLLPGPEREPVAGE